MMELFFFKEKFGYQSQKFGYYRDCKHNLTNRRLNIHPVRKMPRLIPNHPVTKLYCMFFAPPKLSNGVHFLSNDITFALAQL